MDTREMLVISIKGKRHRVRVYADHQSGYAAWRRGDEALRDGRLVIVEPATRDHAWASKAQVVDADGTYLALRAPNDPGWASTPVVSIATTRSVRGIQSIDRAIAALVRQSADRLHGHTGGWLYIGTDPDHRTCRLTNHQGWSSWWWSNSATHKGEIAYTRTDAHGFKYHLVTAL